MKSPNFLALTFTISLIFSVSAMAESMTSNQYTSQKKSIEVEYKSAKADCDSLAGNANKTCVTEAKSNKNVANAELKYKYKPSVKSRFGFSIAKADAEYAVAAAKCDDKAGKVKDVCVKEARTAQIQQITDAKVKAKTMKASPETKAEMIDQEQIDDDTDSAVTEIKPIGSDTILFGKDIFRDRIRIVAMLRDIKNE